MAQAKKKVAIVGGGVSALTCAHHLSRTPELREQYEVTVYQLGWRLGGKGASGRNLDPALGRRAEEHGLHIWFGFYENAFALMREAYDVWEQKPDNPYRTWEDAFEGHDVSSHGELRYGRHVAFTFEWPSNTDVPGTDRVLPTPPAVITGLVGLLHDLVEGMFETGETDGPGGVDRLPLDRLRRMRRLMDAPQIPGRVRTWRAARSGGRLLALPGKLLAAAGRALGGAIGWGVDESLRVFTRFRWLFGELREFGDALSDGFQLEDLSALRELLAYFHDQFREAFEPFLETDDDLRRGWYVIDLGTAVVRGLLNPEYRLLEDGTQIDLGRIDHYELRQWLIENGADPDVVRDAFPLRMLYDAAFQYEDGDIERPNYAAGVAIRVLIRICLTYKGHIYYKMKMAMGEAVVTPVYEALKQNGVRFEFFAKVEELGLDEDGNVATLLVERQARTKDDKAYEPTFEVHGFPCWPSEPFWDQLVDGEKLKAAGVNFESHWSEVPGAAVDELRLGRDFDEVVLAVPVGVYKQLNDEPGMCDALIERSDRFRTMCETLGLVPTQAVQVWLDRDMAAMGWTHGQPAFIPAAEPLDTWAEMPEVIATEDWPGDAAPRALAFFCGVLGTALYREPSTSTSTPERALNLVRDNAETWFDRYAYSIWPEATREREPDGLDWSVLFDPKEHEGVERLRLGQYVRANVDPTECCVASHAGTITARPRAGEFRDEIPNLVLTGAWIRTGMNTTCVESAVMAGMQAAQLLCGSPEDIVGNTFLQSW